MLLALIKNKNFENYTLRLPFKNFHNGVCSTVSEIGQDTGVSSDPDTSLDTFA